MKALENNDRKHNVPKTDDEIEVLTSLLKDAIEFLAPEDKSAYVEACRRCPEILNSESSAVDFLRFENYDIWKAAQRLVKYWQWRYDLFGERAFRSIFDLTGAGAFDEIDLRILATKAHMILPNDVNGDGVVLFDRNKYGKEFFNIDIKGLTRQIFFMCEVLRQEQHAEGRLIAEGGTLVVLPSMSPWLLRKKGWPELIRDALPIVMKWGRYIVLSKEKSQKTWFQAIFPVLQSQILKKFKFTNAEIYCHDTELDLKWELVSLGLREDGIPESLGGSWDEKSFSFWSRLPKSLEKSSCQAVVPNLKDGCDFQKEAIAVQSHSPNIADTPDGDDFPLDDEIAKIQKIETYSLVKAREDGLIAVQKESFQTKFLKFHNQQPQAAAKHVALYWSIREKTFVDRYSLCMNQVGSGALHKKDIQTLRTGFVVLLPKDNHGNYVLLYNPSKLSQNDTVPCQKRVWFYLLFLIIKQSLDERIKIRIIVFMSEMESKNAQKKGLSFQDILKAFPVDVTPIHLILEEQGLKDESYRHSATLKTTSRFGISNHDIILHTLMPDFDFMRDELAIYGLEPDHIPTFLGGTWEYEYFLEWQDRTIQQEASDRHHEHFRDEEKWQILQKKLNQSKKSAGTYSDHDDKLFETVRQAQKRRALNPTLPAYSGIPGGKFSKTDIQQGTTDSLGGNDHGAVMDLSATSRPAACLDQACATSSVDLLYSLNPFNQTIPVNLLDGNSFDQRLHTSPQLESLVRFAQQNNTVHDSLQSSKNVREDNHGFEGLTFSYRSSVTDYWRSRLN